MILTVLLDWDGRKFFALLEDIAVENPFILSGVWFDQGLNISLLNPKNDIDLGIMCAKVIVDT